MTGHDRSTGTRAASRGLTNTPFVHPKVDLFGAEHFHKTGIALLRERRMAFDHRSPQCHGRLVHAVNQTDSVGITDGYGRDFQRLTLYLQGVSDRALHRIKRHLLRIKPRHPHIHRHLAVTVNVQLNVAASGLHPDTIATDQFFIANKTGKTAGAVTALFNFIAIGVEDTVAKIHVRIGGRLNQQQLVKANTEPTIGQAADFFRWQAQILRHHINHHKVVTQAMHFGEM